MSKATARPESLIIGRDESWMAFNRRVLEEAQDSNNPLLERVKFLAITASNLDEFVEIRVAGVLQRIEDGYKDLGVDGLTPEEFACFDGRNSTHRPGPAPPSSTRKRLTRCSRRSPLTRRTPFPG